MQANSLAKQLMLKPANVVSKTASQVSLQIVLLFNFHKDNIAVNL